MLPAKAVGPAVLELIKSLQTKPCLHGFYLAGGTALALYLNHRKSADIDLFSGFSFDAAALLEEIHQHYPFQLSFSAANTLKGSISEIKVDIIAHRYKLIDEPKEVQGVTLLSIPDIIAMKLNAISTSGQRSKDFIDIYYLLRDYKMGKMLEFYREKYDQENAAFILKSLIYFEDVDLADWPVLIKDPKLKWADVTKQIQKVVLDYSHHA